MVAVGNPYENIDPAAALLEKTGHNAEAIEFLDALVKSAPWDTSYLLRLAKAKLAAGKDAATAQDALVSIASGTNASYDLRIKAAAAIAGRTHLDLGSGELNLLAGPAAAITSSSADKFYFYAARMGAAQNTSDSRMKMQLLSHCVIDFPRRDEARVPLFLAAAAANSNEYALGVMEPLFQTRFLRNYAPENGNEEGQIASSGLENDNEESEETNASLPATPKVSRAQDAEVAQTIGDTMSRVGRLVDALSYYQMARRLEPSPTLRKKLLRKIADIKNVLRIEHQNAARQPLLHEALEQDRVVRPRLLARVTPAHNPPTAKGAVQ